MDKQQRAALAERLYTQDGLILRDIAQRLGVSKETIRKDLKSRNVPRRPGPEYYRKQWQANEPARKAEKQKAKEERKAAWEEQQGEQQLWQVERLIRSL